MCFGAHYWTFWFHADVTQKKNTDLRGKFCVTSVLFICVTSARKMSSSVVSEKDAIRYTVYYFLIFFNTFSAAFRPVSAAPFIKPQNSVLQCSPAK